MNAKKQPKQPKSWKARAKATRRRIAKLPPSADDKTTSVRTVSGGLPTLGKNHS